MSKVTSEHLARAAFVYVRQSTAYQVVNNLESQRRQYGLVDRARQLGWNDVQVIDDDLGRSGGGIVRPGFEKLLAAICEGRVGAVVSLEASRLARNGRDWHTLLEFCGLVGTLLVDEEAIFDPRSPNDRLLLGMKGTMSEMELSTFRQRSIEAMRQKARRGELHLTVAVGYAKTVRLGLVALDGTKVGANAALDANRTASRIDEQVARMLAEAEATDAQEDGRCGAQRGDELPAALARRGDRLARLRQCQDKLQRQAAEAASRQQEKIDARAAAEQASGKRKRGRKPKPADAAVDPDTVANVSDPESGIMKTRHG